TKKGYILIDKTKIEEDKLMEMVLDAGAEDLKSEGKNYEITTAPADLEKVKEVLKKNNIETQSAEITMIPASLVKVTGENAKAVLALVEELEEHEDVQAVHANFDIPDDILEQLASSK
ncbi:MAG: YebC/PmpR family DNA-binding transcriptional regulator, partial [Candidatus Omnitrophica bacterium]|nr:YebC/PmpR family DNA-binding transcriptional regulator [Candidatus Omnitrophota bacterium]